MKSNINYSIYLVTDNDLKSTLTLEQAVENAIKGGCTVVQLREKKLSTLEFYNTATRIKAITDYYNIPLIINDRIDIAMAIDAAGVHVGQSDLPAKVVRNIIGINKIVGVSVSNLRQAINAEKDGADYIGVGAMFTTKTKTNAELVSIDELKSITKEISIPIVVIGGINISTIPLFYGIKIDGIALVSAILAQDDIIKATSSLKDLFLNKIKIGYE